LGPDTIVAGLDDSKRLTRERRADVAARVRERAIAFCIAHAEAEEIDAVGITAAVRLAWGRAVDGLGIAVDHVLVDGNDGTLGRPATAVIGGDGRVAAIAAASCVAKVERDRLMEDLASVYPGYEFESNRGYGTPGHLAALARLGPSSIHRRSFAPCSDQGGLF
jgi:ribonuclease HII